MEPKVQMKSQVIKADTSIASTLSRLENVRAQVELIREDTDNLKQYFTDMAKRIDVLAAHCRDEREIILLKRRTKAWGIGESKICSKWILYTHCLQWLHLWDSLVRNICCFCKCRSLPCLLYGCRLQIRNRTSMRNVAIWGRMRHYKIKSLNILCFNNLLAHYLNCRQIVLTKAIFIFYDNVYVPQFFVQKLNINPSYWSKPPRTTTDKALPVVAKTAL